ncbi:MAG: hypothetical protein CMH54_05595 [Myxococcales bacterium]|nr:hypothetical protein [Myxococcales bacterium]
MKRFVYLYGLCVLLIVSLFGCQMPMGMHETASDARHRPGAPMVASEGQVPEIPVDNTGDTFEDVGTNPFVLVDGDPLSTFAADVDTASYDIFRRDINNGLLPVPTSVRLEEYVNYFDYDYPVPIPDLDGPFTLTLDSAPNPFTEGTDLISIGIRGREMAAEKKPTNLVFLVDTSGSMSSTLKIGLVKLVLKETLEVLYDTDTISIVTYAGNTSVALEATPVSDKAAILQAIDDLGAHGSTAGAAGLTLAYEQAETAFIEDGMNHILLCTDGDFNVGPSSDDALVDLIEEKRKTGITFTVLGFGTGNLNDSMMEKISNAGNGVYGVISDADQATNYVYTRMLSTMLFIAQDMKIQVEFNPEQVLAYRLLGYENRAIKDEEFRDDKVDAGEVGAGHTVTALYEIVRTGGLVPVPEGAPELVDNPPFDGETQVEADELCRVKIRYKEVGATEEDPAFEVWKSISTVSDDLSDASADMQWAASVAAISEVLKGSPYASMEKLELAVSLIHANIGNDPLRVEFAALLDQAMLLLTENPN